VLVGFIVMEEGFELLELALAGFYTHQLERHLFIPAKYICAK
jgi:hypothetical protein